MTVHYAVINDFGLYEDTNAACGNNFRRRKRLTTEPEEVTCRECLTLCGFEAAPVEQLTVVHGDPIEEHRRAA